MSAINVGSTATQLADVGVGRLVKDTPAGTTTGPLVPAGAWWMCAIVTVSRLATRMSMHTSLLTVSIVTAAATSPSGSAGGTSFAPESIATYGLAAAPADFAAPNVSRALPLAIPGIITAAAHT